MLVDDAHEGFASIDEGEPSRVYPALAKYRPACSGSSAHAGVSKSRGALSRDPADAVDVYTRQSALAVTARDLARGWVRPRAGRREPQ